MIGFLRDKVLELEKSAANRALVKPKRSAFLASVNRMRQAGLRSGSPNDQDKSPSKFKVVIAILFDREPEAEKLAAVE